jgi:cytoskeleton protein RodZ
MARGSFGELLHRERELREISLNELTVGTRVPLKFIEALQNEDWEKLPGGIFNRGYVRAIARFLGLSEERFLAEYDQAIGERSDALPSRNAENRIPAPRKWLVVFAALILLLAVAGAVAGAVRGWRRYSADRAAKHAAASVPLDLALSTSVATHVRVLADGKLLLDADLPAGESRRFSAAQQFEVTAADSGGVLLALNGQTMPSLGPPGSSGTIVLSQKDLRQARNGNP